MNPKTIRRSLALLNRLFKDKLAGSTDTLALVVGSLDEQQFSCDVDDMTSAGFLTSRREADTIHISAFTKTGFRFLLGLRGVDKDLEYVGERST